MKTWNLSLEELEARIAPDPVASPTILRDPGADGTGPSTDDPSGPEGGNNGQGEANGHDDRFFRMVS